MVAKAKKSNTRVVAHNPLEGEQLLLDAMFGGAPAAGANDSPAPRAAAPRATEPRSSAHSSAPRTPLPKPRVEKPTHYKIVSISLYTEDIERLDAMVRELKRRGHYKANKSQLIRIALSELDLDKVAKNTLP